MKTVNGVPQFEERDYDKANYMGTKGVTLNTQLREWAESRRCVRCENKRTSASGYDYCLGPANLTQVNPEQFSCAAFEEKK